MSEYQYYEFQAIERNLTEKEMSELRTFSTRAEITPNSFVNEYTWGGLREMRICGWKNISMDFFITLTGERASLN